MIIALFHGRGTVSALIRWQTRAQYSHCAAVTSGALPIIWEAWPGKGVRSTVLNDIEGIDFFDVDTTPEQERIVEEFYAEQAGKPYDYVGVANFITRIPRVENPDHWFCSSILFAACQAAGIDLLRGVRPNEVTPFHISISPLLAPRGIPPNVQK